MRAPYYVPAQISFERSLPGNSFVTVAYDFVRGIKPNRTRDINAPLPETGIRPIPEEGQIVQLQDTGKSWYQHVKASVRQRFSIFNITANYTYLWGLSDQEADSRGRDVALPSNSYNLHQDWGNPGNPHHTFNASVNSKMPMDVYLTTTIAAKSGTFYNVTTGKDDNKDGAISDRPPGLPKYSAVGPHFFNVSFNFSKAFELRGVSGARTQRRGPVPTAAAGAQMNVFANLNNAFNMTHPGTPSGVMTSPFFGRSFNATSPREIEVGMRFQF
jgi:hypothetical protein